MPTKFKPSYGPSGIAKWKFEEHELPERWRGHIATLPQRFLMYIDGDDGAGKTEYVLHLSKDLAITYGKVFLNNVEQGKHKQIQESCARNHFERDIPAGKFMYSSYNDFEEYKAKLKSRNSGRIQIIDSISYWPLSVKQVQELIETFKTKSFIFVAYKAHYNTNKPIAHLCDIKVRVADLKAESRGRFSGHKTYVIWDKPKGVTTPQLALYESVNGKN